MTLWIFQHVGGAVRAAGLILTCEVQFAALRCHQLGGDADLNTHTQRVDIDVLRRAKARTSICRWRSLQRSDVEGVPVGNPIGHTVHRCECKQRQTREPRALDHQGLIDLTKVPTGLNDTAQSMRPDTVAERVNTKRHNVHRPRLHLTSQQGARRPILKQVTVQRERIDNLGAVLARAIKLRPQLARQRAVYLEPLTGSVGNIVGGCHNLAVMTFRAARHDSGDKLFELPRGELFRRIATELCPRQQCVALEWVPGIASSITCVSQASGYIGLIRMVTKQPVALVSPASSVKPST